MVTKLTTRSWVMVANGGRALVFENSGTALEPRLREVKSKSLPNPPAREQGTDRPGRYPDALGPSRSAVDATDFHDEAEKKFMADLASELEADLSAGRFEDLVVALAPRALGHFRKAMSPHLRSRVTLEIAKDFTREPIKALEASILRELGK